MNARPDFDPGFSTAAMQSIWSAESRVRRFCDVEAALARATASARLIPESAARAVENACATLDLDAVRLLDEGWSAGSPVIVLLAQLRTRLDAADASFLHYGATSQDVIDTATMLQTRDALGVLAAFIRELADGLASLIERHPADWVMARTLMRPALPVRFALRVARWLEPMLESLEALDAARAHLPVQLGGPVGDLASFADAADAVVNAFAHDLGLSVPRIPWHTDRGPVRTTLSLVERAVSSAATIAADLVLLSQPELGEIRLPGGGSSSMPHKENPISAVRTLAAAQACHRVAAIVTGAPPHELERAAGSLQAEWFAVPLVFQTASAALSSVRSAVSALTFDPERATKNLGGATLPDPRAADRLVARVVERHRRLRGTGRT
jgi:3-carboxy-cis,cis-muconate cycloisomerase